MPITAHLIDGSVLNADVDFDSYLTNKSLCYLFTDCQEVPTKNSCSFSIKLINGKKLTGKAGEHKVDDKGVFLYDLGLRSDRYRQPGLTLFIPVHAIVKKIIDLQAFSKQVAIKSDTTIGSNSIIQLVDEILNRAIEDNVSDLHIRAEQGSVIVQQRLDGVLTTTHTMALNYLSTLVSRVKILGDMDIAEHRFPQEGCYQLDHQGNKVDIRIAIMPTVTGESIAIRILNPMVGLKNLADIGFNSSDQQSLQSMLQKRSGMLLVTGPTGSGKSTTLYAILRELAKQNLNIITVEDPVEYHISGVKQTQVNRATEHTFANSLRYILRNDPDVIMIGEIRDRETAKIAVKSAMTGHLVLSTLHTNSSVGTVTRLLEMGVEPCMIKDTLLGVLAQRLVRRCVGNNVYSGQVAIYELLQVTEKLGQKIIKGITAAEISKQAKSLGMVTMQVNGAEMVKQGITSQEELDRAGI